MVRIRLLRAGAKKRPFYRVIAIDQRRKRDGRALEFLGTYNPIAEPAEIKLKTDRIEAWTAQGAQLSDAVRALIRRSQCAGPGGRRGRVTMAGASKTAELVEFIAKAIVTEPEAVVVSEADGGRTIELETAPGDRGRVIGRQGRVAKAIRAVIGASRTGGNTRLEIID